MILSTSKEEREKALESILPYQQKDFTEIFEVMSGLPVNIRLLDPPLHEFLPQKTEEMQELAKELNISLAKVEERVSSLHEQNPMLGHRGCRLGITYPEIYAMQARAIFEAACDSIKAGFKPVIEVMIPLTIDETELEKLISLVKQTASAVIAKRGINIDYQVGTMIETPRAALIADGIAKVADYFSYGTNDLTQTTLALSRDDSGTFIPDYISTGIFENDPFQVLDTKGVGKLINLSAELARGVKQKIKLGICGEHGGEAKSIGFCVNLGFDYVSCSPYRVPVARLAVAQAQIKKQTAK
jgi:pyruvate,orthophosphate dikinase